MVKTVSYSNTTTELLWKLVEENFDDFKGLKLQTGQDPFAFAMHEEVKEDQDEKKYTEVSWIPWVESVPKFTIPQRAAYASIVVPTVDSIRMLWVEVVLGEVF